MSGDNYVTLSGSYVTISGITPVSLSGDNYVTLSGSYVTLSGVTPVSLSGDNYVTLSGSYVTISGVTPVSLSGDNYVTLSGDNYVTLSGTTNISGNVISHGSKYLPFSQNSDGSLNVNVSGIILNTSGISINSISLSNETSSIQIYGYDGTINKPIKTDTSGKIYTIQNNLNKTTDNITAVLCDNNNNYINSINLPLTTNYGLITHNIFDYSYNQINFSGTAPIVISNSVDINKYKNLDFICESINITSPIIIYVYISRDGNIFNKTNIYFDINEYDTTYAMTNITINARYVQFHLQTLTNISQNSLNSYILMKG